MDLDQFQCLLISMQSSDNNERANAEGVYSNLLDSNGMAVVVFLTQISQANLTNSNVNLFLYSLILLKNIFMKFPAIFLSDPNCDQNIQSFLLNLIDNPSEVHTIQLNVSTLIVTAAKLYLQNQRWPSFQSDIIQRCSSQNKFALTISLDCLILSIHLSFIDVQMILPLIDGWYQMIWPSEPSYLHLLIIRLIFILTKNKCVCQCFSDFINCFPTFIFSLPAQFANKVLSDLTNYSNAIHSLFGPNFNQLFECYISIFTDIQRNKGERELVLELLVEITESNPNEMYAFIEVILSSLMAVICEISGPDFIDEDYEDTTPRTSAENSIRRFSICFLKANEKEFPVLLFNFFNHFNEISDSPEKLRASYVLMRETIDLLVPFFQSGDSCEILVSKIINGLQFPNAFCQFASLQVLSEAAHYLCPDFQRNFNPIFIHPLLSYIQSNPNTSQFAFEALSYIISGSDNEDIEQYLDELYQAVISFFNQIPISAQVFDLKCVSSLIEKTGEKMALYYQIILPLLISVIQMNNLALTLTAIKAFSMIGFSYISDQFISDAKKFMDFILTIKRENFTDDQNDTINSALTAFVTFFGSHYPEIFAQLMLSVIEVINQPIKAQQIPLASDRSDIIDEILIPNESENLLYVYNRNQTYEIYRSLITLSSFLPEIGAFVVPYYQQLIEVLMKTISYFFDDEIQSETILCLKSLIIALSENNIDNMNLFALVIESFNNLIMDIHQDFTIIQQFLDFAVTLSNCIPNVANVEPRFLESILILCMKSIERCKIEEEDQLTVFSDTAKLLKFITECSQINQQISEKLQWLSQNVFLLSVEAPPFMIPGIVTFLSSYTSNLLHDSNAFNNVFQFITQILNVLDNEYKESAFMALSEMIELNLFTIDHANAILPNLYDFLISIDITDTELKNSIDATIYVLTCLFQKYPSLLDNQNVIDIWFKALPLKGNKSPRFTKVYDFLLILISQNNPIVTQNLAHLLKVISKAIKGANSSDQAKATFKAFIQNLSSNSESKDLFNISFDQLNSKDQERILCFLEEEI